MEKVKDNKRYLRNLAWLFILFCLNTAGAFAQFKVSGTITDTNKEALIGVNIVVSGAKTGTISDFDGKYSIDVPNSKAVLVFSYIGYKTVIQEVAGKSIVNIELIEDSKTIDEVVVVAYGTQKKSHLTGAVSSLKNDKLDELAFSRVDQALQGKLAGVQINRTNPEAGEAPIIRVRGMGSISANSEPLVVIDGFPISEGLSMVSMGDVESIEVLKDAASASLYGSRAAGGVILVTTKSGNIKKPKYTFKMFTGVSSALKLPDMLSTDKYTALLFSEAAQRELDPAVNGLVSGANATMAFNKITDAERAAYFIQKNFLDAPTDWLAEGLRDRGSMQNYQLSASGGDKNLKYYISGNYNNELGIMKNSSYDKFNFKAKIDAKLSNTITLGVNIAPTYSRQQRAAVDLTDYMRFQSWLPIRHNQATASLKGLTAGDEAQATDFYSISLSGFGYNNEVWNLDGVTPWTSANQNPVSIREKTSIFNDEYKLQSNMYLSIDITPELQFKTSNGVYLSYKEYNKKEKTSANKAGIPNTLTRRMNLKTDFLSENTLNFNKTIGGHEIGALAGFTLQKTNNELNQMVGTNFPDEEVLSFNYASKLLLNSPTVDGVTSFYYSEALASFIGRVNYAYKGKYLVSASIRSDGSTKFAKGNQWGTFPAAALGWRASEENFLKRYEWLSNLKLRASYGLTGNNNIEQYSYMNTINTSNYVLGKNNGNLMAGMSANNVALGNPDISWEQTSEANFGIDFGFVNSRFNFSVEYYNSNTIQLLLKQPAMFITGHQTSWNNIGRVNNQGIEFEVSTTNISTRNFIWKTTANISHNKNTLKNYGDKDHEDITGERTEAYRAQVGQPSIQFWGYRSNGVYTTFEEVAAAKALTGPDGKAMTYSKFAPVIGGLKVVDINNDFKINTDDREVIGNPFPDFSWAISNTFNYKDFDLSFMFQGVQGLDVVNGNIYYNEQLRYNTAYTTNRYVSPMFPGDGRTVYSNTTSGTDLLLTDYAVEDGSYAALRDLSFGYTIPTNVIRKLKIGGVRAYFSAQNLLYFMAPGYKGINPEARKTSGGNYSSPLVDGYQRGAFPLNRTYTVGFDLTF